MIDECIECGDDGCRRDVRPDVVGAELHLDDVGFGDGEPAGNLIVADYARGEETTVAVVRGRVAEGNGFAAAVLSDGADEGGVGDAGGLETVVEDGAPATLSLLV